jgi:replicative DNA helicase
MPPHSLEAEKAVLGSIAIDPDAIHEIDYLKPQHFYSSYNASLFDGMQRMIADDVAPDMVTLTQWVKDFDEVGYIGLLTEVPTSTRIKEYADIVRETSKRRDVIGAASRVATIAYDGSKTLSEVLEGASTELIAVSGDETISKGQHVRELALEALELIEKRRLSGGEVQGLLTHWPDLDMLLRGIEAPGLYVLAARPGLGKTAFASDLIYNILSKDSSKRAVFFNLEMFGMQITMRMISQQAGIPRDDVNEGNFNDSAGEMNMAKVMEATGKISEMDLVIFDTPGMSSGQIYAQCQREIAANGRIDFIVIDYLQLMSSDANIPRTRAIGQITQDLKLVAKKLRIPVILLSQLSRKVEERQNKRPMLSDLRDSGEIEQNADVVIFLYRDSYYKKFGDEDEEDEEFDYSRDENIAEVNVAKNRMGAEGRIEMFYDMSCGHFATLRKDEIAL